jgi:hypothetical protein
VGSRHRSAGSNDVIGAVYGEPVASAPEALRQRAGPDIGVRKVGQRENAIIDPNARAAALVRVPRQLADLADRGLGIMTMSEALSR